MSGQHSAAASDRHGAHHAAAAGHNRVPEGAHSMTVMAAPILQPEVAYACTNKGDGMQTTHEQQTTHQQGPSLQRHRKHESLVLLLLMVHAEI